MNKLNYVFLDKLNCYICQVLCRYLDVLITFLLFSFNAYILPHLNILYNLELTKKNEEKQSENGPQNGIMVYFEKTIFIYLCIS